MYPSFQSAMSRDVAVLIIYVVNPLLNLTFFRRYCVLSLSKNINPSLVLVQPRKTRPYITEKLLIGRKESNQTNKQNKSTVFGGQFSVVTNSDLD